MKLMAFVLTLLFATLTEGSSFWRNRKVNCAVSIWSDWSSPASDGTRIRSRTVVRRPRNGGSGCPRLSEEQGDTNTWDQSNVDKKFHNKFMTGHTHYYGFVDRDGLSVMPGDQSTGGDTSNELTLLPRDLLFIIDMSGSITHEHWTTTKRKLADLIERLCGGIGRGRQNNRIAIVTFSDRVMLNFNFKTHWTIASVRRAILNMPQEGGYTCTGDAFVYAHRYMFEPDTGMRSAAESVKEVLVLTDGHSNCGAELSLNIRRLQVKAFVFALAIGDYGPSGKAEIESMVTRPVMDHIFSLLNFFKFEEMVDAILSYPDNCAPFELS